MKLRMKCNPEHALDHGGAPHAVVQVPWTSGAQTQWVCAKLDMEQSPMLGGSKHHQGRHVFIFDREAVFEYELNPFEVASFEYYQYFKRQIADGCLEPADKATADECGCPWPLPKDWKHAPQSEHPLAPAFKVAVDAKATQVALAHAKARGEDTKPAQAADKKGS